MGSKKRKKEAERAKREREREAEKEMQKEAQVDEEITVKPVFEFDGWAFIQAEQGTGDKKLIRWVARHYRQLIMPNHDQSKPTEPLYYCTEVVAGQEQDSLSIYSFHAKKETEMRVSGLMKPDPIPITVIATILGLKASFEEQGRLLTPDDPEFQQIKNRLELSDGKKI